jgi:hypothetical protein
VKPRDGGGKSAVGVEFGAEGIGGLDFVVEEVGADVVRGWKVGKEG